MARRFVTGDSLAVAIGSLPTTRVGTWIMLIRPYDSTFDLLATNTDFLTSRNGTTAVHALFLDNGKIFSNNDFGSGATGPTDKNGWYAMAVTKATGTVAFRYHLAPLGGTWVHTGSGTSADGSGVTNYLFGTGSIKAAAKFEIAAAAVYSAALSDTAIEALGTTSMASWMSAGPVGAWQFNQSATTTAVSDLTGNGANQTALTGTAITTDPVGWTYSGTTTPFTKTVTESYRVFNALTKTVSESYRVLNTFTANQAESYRVLNAWTKTVSEAYRVFNTFTVPVSEGYRVLGAWTKTTTETYRVLAVWTLSTSEAYRVLGAWSLAVSDQYRVLNGWSLSAAETYRILNAWNLPAAESYRVFNAWSLSAAESYNVLSGTAFTVNAVERYRIFNTFAAPYVETYRILAAFSFSRSETYRILNAWTFSQAESYRLYAGWAKTLVERYAVGDVAPLPPHAVNVHAYLSTFVQANLARVVLANLGPATVTADLDDNG